MNWLSNLISLFSLLFSFAAVHFIELIGLITVSGIIGGLVYFIKRLLSMKWSREDE